MTREEPVPVPVWLMALGVGITLFHLWANTVGTLPTLWFNALHVGLFGAFGALLLVRKPGSVAAILPAAVFLVGGFYLLPASEWLPLRGEQLTGIDQAVAAAMIVALVWLCGRTSGWTMPVLVALCVLYVTVFGRYIDGVFHFRGLGLERVLYRFYFTGEGMFGFVTTLSATYVFLFVLFGAFGLVALASLILGMGLPVTAAYVVTAVAAAGALEELGVALLAAHLLIFWLSQDSNITPPVCLTAFAAAGIAGCNPFAAGFSAWRLAKALYLVPLLFVFRPLVTGGWGERLAIAGFAAVGIVLIYAAVAGWLRFRLAPWQRPVLLLAGALCFWPSWWMNVIGALILPLAWRFASNPATWYDSQRRIEMMNGNQRPTDL